MGVSAVNQLAWRIPVNSDTPTEPLSAEGVELVHDAAMRVLEEIGIDFLHEGAKKILKDAGCDVDPCSSRVRMDRAFVMEQVRKAPAEFKITPRNAERTVTIGGNHMVFANVSAPPNSSNLDRGRRPGMRSDYQDLIKLTQYFNCIHITAGYPVEPLDVHPSVRHLDCLEAPE